MSIHSLVPNDEWAPLVTIADLRLVLHFFFVNSDPCRLDRRSRARWRAMRHLVSSSAYFCLSRYLLTDNFFTYSVLNPLVYCQHIIAIRPSFLWCTMKRPSQNFTPLTKHRPRSCGQSYFAKKAAFMRLQRPAGRPPLTRIDKTTHI